MTCAREWIDRLQLGPHPEGGWFREIYRSAESILAGCTVAPGFSFEDFELADPDALLREFPHAASLLRERAPDS
jgi:hypothetical protein